MNFTCTKENAVRALALMSGVTGKSVNLPILSNVLIRADEQKVDFIATNLEVALTVTIRAKIEAPGAFTVPARTLVECVGLAPTEKIVFVVHDNELVVTAGKAVTKIKGTGAEDFPVIPTLETGSGFVLEAAALREGLNQVLPAVAKSDIRPELSGVLLELDGEKHLATLAATDSYRLAERKFSLQQGSTHIRVVVPGRTAQEIEHVLSPISDGTEENVRVLVGDNQLALTFQNIQLVSRLVSGEYPDYTQIIPTAFTTTVEISTDALVKELKAAGLFTTSGVNAATLTVEPESGALKIFSASLQTGEYASELPVKITGVQTTTVLNYRYVLEGLARMGAQTVVMKLINSDSPCIFTPAGENKEAFIYIVMPIRQ